MPVEIERLKTLSKALRTYKEKECIAVLPSDFTFNLNHWWNDETREHPCKTVGCALGIASCIPEFVELGLSHDTKYGSVRYKDPDGLTHSDGMAAREFFGLAYWQSSSLFHPDGYYAWSGGETDVNAITAEMVADKIDDFLASLTPPTAEGEQSCS